MVLFFSRIIIHEALRKIDSSLSLFCVLQLYLLGTASVESLSEGEYSKLTSVRASFPHK